MNHLFMNQATMVALYVSGSLKRTILKESFVSSLTLVELYCMCVVH